MNAGQGTEPEVIIREGEAEDAKSVVMNLRGLGRIDITGALVLRQLKEDLARAGVQVDFTEVPDQAKRLLGEVLAWDRA